MQFTALEVMIRTIREAVHKGYS